MKLNSAGDTASLGGLSSRVFPKYLDDTAFGTIAGRSMTIADSSNTIRKSSSRLPVPLASAILILAQQVQATFAFWSFTQTQTQTQTQTNTNTNTSARLPPRFCMPMHAPLYYLWILLRFSTFFVTTAQFAINCDSHSKASSKCDTQPGGR